MTTNDESAASDTTRRANADVPQPNGKPGSALLRHVGTISPDDMDRMAAAIEDECERIDPDGW